MFNKHIIDTETNFFKEFSESIEFEDITKGRKGAVLVDYKENLMPIVRTTTNYRKPCQKFKLNHYKLMDEIKKIINIMNKDIEFNNAMIEIYEPNYRKMGYHTDQSLDLKENSYICLFSCYENNSNNLEDLRKLKIKNKITEKYSEILLENNSIVLFSTSTNFEHKHKIVLDSITAKNRWLGITFRTSKTFIKFNGNVPCIYPFNKVLKIANDEEKKDFFKHKKNENINNIYIYPYIDYTISINDTLVPY